MTCCWAINSWPIKIRTRALLILQGFIIKEPILYCTSGLITSLKQTFTFFFPESLECHKFWCGDRAYIFSSNFIKKLFPGSGPSDWKRWRFKSSPGSKRKWQLFECYTADCWLEARSSKYIPFHLIKTHNTHTQEWYDKINCAHECFSLDLFWFLNPKFFSSLISRGSSPYSAVQRESVCFAGWAGCCPCMVA